MSVPYGNFKGFRGRWTRVQILVLFTNQLVKRFLNSWSFFFIFKIINLYLIRILRIKRNIIYNAPHTVPDKSRHLVSIVIIVQDTEDTGISKKLGTTCFEISMEISKQKEVN